MALQPGEIIDGKYRIIRELGSGSMGAVYEGENVRIRRRVAIKVLLPAVAKKGDVVKRFEREAQAAGRIGSEHIVEVLDLGTLADGGFYMVMEFLEGTTLGDRIKKKGRLEPRELVPIVQQLLYGLEMAHEARIIHRDLKPDNIFLVREHAGQKDFVKILDFGVSKFNPLTDDDGMSMTRTGTVMGTPFYMAPEQAKGSKDVDHRSDLYSVGVILYQAVTGQVPFHAGTFNELIFKIVLEQPPPPESYVPDLDPAFGRLIRRAMSRDPDQRFATSSEFAQALSVWLHTGRADGAEHPPPPEVGDEPLDGMSTRVANPDPEAGRMTAIVQPKGPGTEIMDPGDAPLGGGTEMMDPPSRLPPPSRRRPPPRPKTAPLPQVSGPGTIPMAKPPPSSLRMPGAVPVPEGHDPALWSGEGQSEVAVPPPPGMPLGMTPTPPPEAMQKITDRPLSPNMPTPVGRRSPYYEANYEEEPVVAGVPRRSNNRAVAWVVGGVIAAGLAAAAFAVVTVDDGSTDDAAQAAESPAPTEEESTTPEPALDLDADDGAVATTDESDTSPTPEEDEPGDDDETEAASDAGDAGDAGDDEPVSTKPAPAPTKVAARPTPRPAPVAPRPSPKTAPAPAPAPKPTTNPKPGPKPTTGRKIKTEL